MLPLRLKKVSGTNDDKKQYTTGSNTFQDESLENLSQFIWKKPSQDSF